MSQLSHLRQLVALSLPWQQSAGQDITTGARELASSIGVPVAYLYADNNDLAEVILAFGLLPEREQRRLAVELKARVSLPAAKARAKPRGSTARRAR